MALQFRAVRKKQVLVSTYFFGQPEFAKRRSKTHFRASSARNLVIGLGLLLASTWWKYTVNVPLILTIINIDRAVSNPVVHTQRDEMILEDGRTETPCSLNETSSKFRVVACADQWRIQGEMTGCIPPPAQNRCLTGRCQAVITDACMYKPNSFQIYWRLKHNIFQANLLRLRFIWMSNCSFQSLVSLIYPHWCAVI